MADRPQLLWLFFGVSGRVSRAAYFLGGMLVAMAQAFPFYRFMLAMEGTPESALWSIVFMVVFLTSLWSNVALAVKRLHDLGQTGLAAVVLFVPVISIAAFLVLCLFPGQQGPNRYAERTNAPA